MKHSLQGKQKNKMKKYISKYLLELEAKERKGNIAIIADKKLKESHKFSPKKQKNKKRNPKFKNNYKPNSYINNSYKNKT